MSITRNVFAVSASLWLAIGTADADFVGLNINMHNAPGAQSFNSSSIDVVDDLDVDNSTPTSMVLILEHPIAALPNLRYQGYNRYSTDTSATNPELNFRQNSANYTTGSTTSYDLEHDNIVLYYQLLDNWVDLDMGVDLKRFDGEVNQAGLGGSVDIDETIPLLHLSARVDLPIQGLYVGADINANVIDLGISESTAQDSTIKLGYQTGNGLGIEGGIKSFSLELNNTEEVDTDFEYDGLFVNGFFSF